MALEMPVPKFGTTADFRGAQRLLANSDKMFSLAMGRGMLQLLTWMNNGSPRESRTPPIKTGVLRGSSSAIMGDRVVGYGPPEAGATPATSGPKSNPLKGYIVYNTEYAAKMHEWKGGWGDVTEQAVDAGRKWMELHLKADREAFNKLVGIEFGKELKGL